LVTLGMRGFCCVWWACVLGVGVASAGRVHVVELKHRPYSPDEEAEMLSLLQTSEGDSERAENTDLEATSNEKGRLPLVQLNSRFYGEMASARLRSGRRSSTTRARTSRGCTTRSASTARTV